MFQLDKTDFKILEILQSNSQFTIKEVAQKVNLSTTPVHDRIKRLETEGIIEKYVALINRRQVGKFLIAYSNVSLDKQRQENFEDFNQIIKEMKEVVECHVVSGSFDYLLKVIISDMEAYHAFYQRMSAIQGVSHISSFFVMSEVKNVTAIPLQ